MLNRIGPTLDLRELSEDDLHDIHEMAEAMAADQEFCHREPGWAKFHRQAAAAIRDELTYRVLHSCDHLVVPDHLD
jgi:hypothetical protein